MGGQGHPLESSLGTQGGSQALKMLTPPGSLQVPPCAPVYSLLSSYSAYQCFSTPTAFQSVPDTAVSQISTQVCFVTTEKQIHAIKLTNQEASKLPVPVPTSNEDQTVLSPGLLILLMSPPPFHLS